MGSCLNSYLQLDRLDWPFFFSFLAIQLLEKLSTYFLIMREINNIAISLRNISKIYRLHGSQKDQLIDVLGLQRFGIKPKSQSKSFSALSNINLDVPKGHRIGIIGRNGAGKTTLLKLICGNFMPTSGEIEVNGNVQALMSVGLGFHPEYTGRENIEGSLQYNGLTKSDNRNY